MSETKRLLERGVGGFDPDPHGALASVPARARRRHRRRRVEAAVVATVFSVLAGVLLWTAFHSGGATRPASGSAPFLATYSGAGSSDTLGVGGTLTVQGGCVIVRAVGSTPLRTLPLWPAGTTVTSGNGRWIIVGPDGRPFASLGNRVLLGGSPVGQRLAAEKVNQSIPNSCMVDRFLAVGYVKGHILGHHSEASREATACTAGHLALGRGGTVPEATGQESRLLKLTNTSSAPCGLNGYPQIVLADASGNAIPFRYRDGGDQMVTSNPPIPVTLAAGGTAFVMFNKYRCDLDDKTRVASVKVVPPGDTKSIRLSLGTYPVLAYCGPGDPGSVVHISPIEPTARAVIAHH